MIVELWGAGGGGGYCGGGIFCGTPGQGGGAGAYVRSVMTVTPLTGYYVTVGQGGLADQDGGSTQFNASGAGGTILLQAGGGVQGYDAGSFKSCDSQSPPLSCGSGGTSGSGAQIGHTGKAGIAGTNCVASGGTGYLAPGFTTPVGGGGSGGYSSSSCSVQPTMQGQNGYAVLTW